MAGRQMRGLADAIGSTMSHDTQVSGTRLTSTTRNSNGGICSGKLMLSQRLTVSVNLSVERGKSDSTAASVCQLTLSLDVVTHRSV